MKALCTGSHGFIGSHLVKALEERGDEVYPVGYMDFLSGQQGFRDLIGDEVIDYVFHLAAYGNMSFQKEYVNDIFNSNLVGTMNLLMGLKDIPYKAFINVSSSSVTLPHQTMYSATKLGAEALCKAFVDEYDKPIVTVRPYSVYGPGEADFRFIPTVFRSCLTGEPMKLAYNPVHDWIYVDDVVKQMIVMCRYAKEVKGDVLDLGTGVPTHNYEIVDRIEKITGKKANIEGNIDFRSFDNGKWYSRKPLKKFTSLDKGLLKTYEYYKKRYK